MYYLYIPKIVHVCSRTLTQNVMVFKRLHLGQVGSPLVSHWWLIVIYLFIDCFFVIICCYCYCYYLIIIIIIIIIMH